jgi:hypothetical protein
VALVKIARAAGSDFGGKTKCRCNFGLRSSNKLNSELSRSAYLLLSITMVYVRVNQVYLFSQHGWVRIWIPSACLYPRHCPFLSLASSSSYYCRQLLEYEYVAARGSPSGVSWLDETPNEGMNDEPYYLQ